MTGGVTKRIRRRRWRRAGRCRGAVIAVGILAGLFAIPLATTPVRAQEPEFLTLGAGAFDISGSHGTALLSLEYMDKRKWIWDLKPTTGVLATLKGGLYGYAGLSLDIYFGRRIVVTPSFAPGFYMRNGNKDLGSAIEFRSAIKAAYRLDDRSRIGVEFFHLSNLGLVSTDPGANELMLYYSIPFSRNGS